MKGKMREVWCVKGWTSFGCGVGLSLVFGEHQYWSIISYISFLFLSCICLFVFFLQDVLLETWIMSVISNLYWHFLSYHVPLSSLSKIFQSSPLISILHNYAMYCVQHSSLSHCAHLALFQPITYTSFGLA